MSELAPDSIRRLLFSEEDAFYEVGVQMLLGNLRQTGTLAVEALLACSPQRLTAYRENLIRYFPFLGTPFAAPTTTAPDRFELFEYLAEEFRHFLSSVRTVMESLAPSEREGFMAQVALLPGIAPEVSAMVRRLWGPHSATEFDRAVQEAVSKNRRRQLMLFLSYRCNLKCPYCFAADLRSEDLPVERALEILRQARRRGITMITYCGGEPTLYPAFGQLLAEMEQAGMETYFATNLLSPPAVLERLSPEFVRALIVHVAHPQVYRDGRWETFERNIQTVRARRIPVGFRINLYREDHNWSHLFGLIERTDVRDVQLAYAFPNAAGTNRHTTLENMQRLIPSTLDLMDRCSDRGVRMVFSKPIPPCLFPEERSRRFIRRIEYLPKCSVFEDRCTHNLCVSPSEELFPCLGMMDRACPPEDAGDWERVAAFCTSQVLPILSASTREACGGCFLYHRRLCQGLCLGHKRSMKSITCH